MTQLITAGAGEMPVVTFGKYKGRPVTDLLADSNYAEWCKLQPWFNKTPIYNVVVNQHLARGAHDDAPTPDHNRLQNRFLGGEFVKGFVQEAGVSTLKTTRDYWCDSVDWSSVSEFEAEFNWDVKIRGESLRYFTYGGSCAVCAPHIWSMPSSYDPRGKVCECETVAQVDRVQSSIYVEIKPLLGDEYPCVLRKMKLQINLMIAKHYRPPAARFILLVGRFESSVTSREELVKMFRISHVHVLFFEDIQAAMVANPPPVTTTHLIKDDDSLLLLQPPAKDDDDENTKKKLEKQSAASSSTNNNYIDTSASATPHSEEDPPPRKRIRTD